MGEWKLDDLLVLLNDDDGAFDETVDDPQEQSVKVSEVYNEELTSEEAGKTEMAKKLQEMEEQVRMMKEQLSRENERGSGSSTLGKFSVGDTPPPDAAAQVTRTEVKMISPMRSVSDKRLLSPAKIISLDEAERRPAKPAIYVARSAEPDEELHMQGGDW